LTGDTELARALGVAGQTIEIAPAALIDRAGTPSCPPGRHPLLLEADAAVRSEEARKRAVDLTYLPRLDIVGALWVRGSGLTSGTLGPSPGNGIVPDTANWAAGLVVDFPVLDVVAVRARSRAQAAQVGVAQARRRDLEQAVQSQVDSARAVLDAARRVADNTPIAFQAARAAEAQATARYRAGLATIDLVAEAQRILAQAEIDDAVARLNVRRAELLLARAVGDISPFVTQRCGGR
jgi:outer membrane protein TolC